MSEKEVDKGGIRPFYKTPEEMQLKIDEYFKEKVCHIPFLDKEGQPLTTKAGKIVYDIKPPTIAGLSHYLGFASRQSMYDYKNKTPEFSYIIERTITLIEEYAEIQLTQGNSQGAIFWLKNRINNNWKDKQETEHSGEVTGIVIKGYKPKNEK